MATQLVGYSELMGEIDEDLAGEEDIGYDEEIGAHKKKHVAKANRRYPLGLGNATVLAGGTAILKGVPPLLFRTDRLMLVPTAPGLLVTQIMAANVAQSLGSNGSPVEAFGPGSFGAAMTGQTVSPGVEVAVTISNPTAGPIDISGTCFGLVDQ